MNTDGKGAGMSNDEVVALKNRTQAILDHHSLPHKDAVRDVLSLLMKALTTKDDRIQAQGDEIERLREALTPSMKTKQAYWGEFETIDVHGNAVPVSWVTVKEIMAAIRARAALAHKDAEE